MFGVLLLGFLKFLGRNKGKEQELNLDSMQDLDMPPPPPMGGKDYFPEDKEFQQLPEFPKLPDMPEEVEMPEMPEDMGDMGPEPKSLQDFPPMNQDFGKSPSMPPVENFPRYEMPKRETPRNEAFMQQPSPLFPMQRPRQLFNPPNPMPQQEIPRAIPQEDTPRDYVPRIMPSRSYEKFEKSALKEERSVLSHKGSKGPIYVRVERFRGIIADAGIIRNNLKMADEVIVKLNEIDENRNKVFDKWHNIMTDMQKKFVFIDKTLFKR